MRRFMFWGVAIVLLGAVCAFALCHRSAKLRDANTKRQAAMSKKEMHPADEPIWPNRPDRTASDVRARVLYDKARKLASEDHLEEGLAALDMVVEKEGKSWYAPLALYQKANWLYHAGRIKEARATFAQVQKRYPDSYLSVRAAERIAKLDLREKRLTAILSTKEPKPVRAEEVCAEGPEALADCGPECLLEACSILGIEAMKPELKSLAKTTGQGTTMLNLAAAARAKGIKAKGKLVNYQYLQEMEMPVIAWVDGNHYVLIKSAGGSGLRIYDPRVGERNVPRREFCQSWRGHVLGLSVDCRRMSQLTEP